MADERILSFLDFERPIAELEANADEWRARLAGFERGEAEARLLGVIDEVLANRP